MWRRAEGQVSEDMSLDDESLLKSLDDESLLKSLLSSIMDENFAEFKSLDDRVDTWDMGGGIHFMRCFFRCRWRRNEVDVNLSFEVRSEISGHSNGIWFQLGDVLLADPQCSEKIIGFVKRGVLLCFRDELLLWRFFEQFGR